MSPKIWFATGLFALIFLSGFRLSGLGKPYGALLFNAHKLIALGALAVLIVTVVQANRATPLGAPAWGLAALALACFLALLVTGGLANLERMPAALTRVHHVLPYLALAASAAVVWFARA
jgi:fatty acid desaturase